MFPDILNVVPRPLVLAGAIYGAVSWSVTGPLVAERMAETRFLPACVAGLKAQPLPKDPAEAVLDVLRNSPLLNDPLMRSLGIDRDLDLARPRDQAAKSRRGNPDTRCRCLVDQAIVQSQTAWALYAGSLRLIVRPEVARIDGLVARLDEEGACNDR
jgi:hypothetical protein